MRARIQYRNSPPPASGCRFSLYTNPSLLTPATRSVFRDLQPHLHVGEQGGAVELREFEPSFAGMVESFVARFPPEDPELLALYRAEKDAVSD